MSQEKDHTKLKDLNLNVVADGGVLVIRQGYEAAPLPLKEPVKVKLEGSIDSLLDFARKRPALLNPANSHLLVSLGDGLNVTATFIHDETSPNRIEVKGSLVGNAELSALGINTARKYSTTDLIKVLKMKRHIFETRDSQAAILTALKQFTASTSIEFQNQNDYAGNVVYSKITKCTSNLVLDFKLKVAPFVGTEPRSFQVIVEVEPVDGQLALNLVSYDLVDILKEYTDKAKADLLDEFSPVPIIQS
jgi:hypothetical protein